MPHIELLGGMAVRGPVAPIAGDALAGRRGRVALAVLAMERGRPVDHDELAAAIWPRELPPTWRPALRSALSRVRDVLEAAGIDAVVVTRGGLATLLLPADVTIDVEAARLDVDRAERALSAGDHGPAALVAGIAADVLATPLLPRETSEWAERHRVRLLHLRSRALHVQCSALVAAGEHDRAVEAAEELVRVEPFGESGHRLLMRALAGAGQRAAALRAYERCRRALADELGVEPDAETTALHLEVLGGATADATGPERPVMSGAITVDGDRRRLDAWWQGVARGGPPVLAVSGESGTGVADLVRQLARREMAGGTVVLWHRSATDSRAEPLLHLARATAAARVMVVVERADALDDLDPLIDLPGLDSGRVALVLGHRVDRPWLAGASLGRLLDAFGRRRMLRRLVMSPLGPGDAARLLESMTGRPVDDAARALAADLVAECGGNQGLMRLRVLGLLASGALRAGPDGWRVPPALGDEPVPGALAEAVTRWAADAPPGLLSLLRRTAAPAASSGPSGPEDDRPPTLDDARLAIACGLLAETADGYRFVHPLVGRCWAEHAPEPGMATASEAPGDSPP